LDHLPRLSARLGGPAIYVKRDDLAGGSFGGNKTRMLEYVLGRAVAFGADTVVGGSAVQSNYSRQLAAACARLGLRCHLVLRRVRPRDGELQGSLLLDHLYGAHVEFVDDRDEQRERFAEVAASLERSGARVYMFPSASNADRPLHAAAYAGAVLELDEQVAAAGVVPTHVYVASLDTTHAGLLLGLRACGLDADLRVFSPNERDVFGGRSIEQEVAAVSSAAAELLGLRFTIAPDDVAVSADHVGDRYGAVTNEAIAALELFASTEAVLLDPVYTAKAAAGLVHDIARGELGPDHTVVFWHTGGVPAVFAYAADVTGRPT
jgi:1-aminocyclopropane-1-carboxylate deaminase/D-cysteine desulfhydrase-like pyridoxal-dependent ACC family enzyme